MNRLYDILDDLATRAKTTTLITRSASGSVVKTAGRYGSLTAPTVDGYDFLCWIWAAPSGWSGVITPSNPTLATVNFYVQYSSSPSTASGDFNGVALYQKTT